MTTPIDKAEIRRLIPHAGTMCLLDSVLGWDDESIVCTTNTHRDEANPLRRDGRLSALHALEYGAQAAAIHGGLRARAAGTTAPPCYLAARETRICMSPASMISLRRWRCAPNGCSEMPAIPFINARSRPVVFRWPKNASPSCCVRNSEL